jgi:hypothetical protein
MATAAYHRADCYLWLWLAFFIQEPNANSIIPLTITRRKALVGFSNAQSRRAGLATSHPRCGYQDAA